VENIDHGGWAQNPADRADGKPPLIGIPVMRINAGSQG
jgi:hypothetical protein